MNPVPKPFPTPSSRLQVILFGHSASLERLPPEVPRFAIYYDVLDELLYHAQYRTQPTASLLLGGLYEDPEHGAFVEVQGFSQATYLPDKKPMHEWMEVLKARRERLRRELQDSTPPRALVGWSFARPACQGLMTEREAAVHTSFFHRDGFFALSIDYTNGKIGVYHRTHEGLLVQVPFWVVAPIKLPQVDTPPKPASAQIAPLHTSDTQPPATPSSPNPPPNDPIPEPPQAAEPPDLETPAQPPPQTDDEPPTPPSSPFPQPTPDLGSLISSDLPQDNPTFSPSDFPLLSLPPEFGLEESDDLPTPEPKRHTPDTAPRAPSMDDSMDLGLGSQDPPNPTTLPDGFLQQEEFDAILSNISLPNPPEETQHPPTPKLPQKDPTGPSGDVVFQLHFGRSDSPEETPSETDRDDSSSEA